jgi:hypothetical protein
MPEKPTIVPRWEWRMFDRTLEAIEHRLGPLPDTQARTSVEIYFLRLGGTQNAKVRDDVFDVKRLLQVDVSGLELWKPVFKIKFPLNRGGVARAFAEWNLPLPRLSRENYSIDDFIGELISPRRELRVAHVEKSRRGFNFQGCIAEFAQLTVDGLRLETFSLEHEEPARILDALRRLGLESVSNTNYPLGLKRALGCEDGRRDDVAMGGAHAS